MLRTLKILTLAGLATLAVSAVGVSAAQAAPEFHCEVGATESCFVHGESSNFVLTLTPGGVALKCTSTTFTGTSSTRTFTELTLAGTHEGCKWAGVKTVIDTNGCALILKLTPGGVAPFPATTSIECPTGKKIQITPTGINCVIDIEGNGQTPAHNQNLEGVTLKNEGSGSTRDVFATFDITKSIHYVLTGTECSEAPGTYTEGDLTGTITLKGFKDTAGVKGVQVGFWID